MKKTHVLFFQVIVVPAWVETNSYKKALSEFNSEWFPSFPSELENESTQSLPVW